MPGQSQVCREFVNVNLFNGYVSSGRWKVVVGWWSTVSTVVSLKWFLAFYLVVLIRRRNTVTFEWHIEVDLTFSRRIYGNSSICNTSGLCCWRWYYLKIEEVARNLDLKDLWCTYFRRLVQIKWILFYENLTIHCWNTY